jgi:hypothetical protein
MYLDVYIGDPTDPTFSWEGGNWSGSVPTRLSPFFPWGRTHFNTVVRMAEEAANGRQTDWGAWVLLLSAKDIQALFNEWYGTREVPPITFSDFPHLQREFDDLRTFVEALDDSKLWALVASEL